MIPIYQNIIDKGDGDCFRAAISSILDLSIEQVPHFIRFGSDWHSYYLKFMRWFGWLYNGNNSPGGIYPLGIKDSINGYYIATVPSSVYENIFHSVIMDTNGIIVHDPNPNKHYYGMSMKEAGVVYWHMFEKEELK